MHMYATLVQTEVDGTWCSTYLYLTVSLPALTLTLNIHNLVNSSLEHALFILQISWKPLIASC